MSRRLFAPALALCVVSCVAIASTATRARTQTAGGVNNQPPRVELKAEQAKPDAAKSNTLTVSEIDEAGLAKLLLRDSSKPARPLLVNFWATWCDPCREEFPDLVKIDTEFRPRGLDFLTVSLDDVAEIKTEVPQFIEQMRAGAIPAYLLNAKDPEAAITAVDKQWRGELPATFLFNAQGQIVFRHMGRIKPAELRQAIEETMKAER